MDKSGTYKDFSSDISFFIQVFTKEYNITTKLFPFISIILSDSRKFTISLYIYIYIYIYIYSL